MTDISVTTSEIGVVFPAKAEIYTFIAASALDAGTLVYIDASGKVNKASASGASPVNRFRGITLEKAGMNMPVSVLVRGAMYGFNIAGLDFDAPVYVSNTTGALADAPGITNLPVGKVMPLADSVSVNKVLYVDGWSG